MDLSNGRIFFLGAGFSAGAGIPLTESLLPIAANIFAQSASGLYERVCDYASQVDVDLNGAPDAEAFARLCTHLEFIELREHAGGERWSANGSKEKLALKFFLAQAIAFKTPTADEVPDCYLEFARSLTPNDIVVTFNWDLLLETAILKVGKEFSHNFEPDKLHIMKPHGSINWINDEPHSLGNDRPSFNYNSLGFKGGMMENEIFSSDELFRFEKWSQARALIDEVNPMLVLPGYGKAFDIRLLAILWYRIEFLNIRGGKVFIIGLNVSSDDFIVESLFRYLFRAVFCSEKPIVVLNPDINVKARFAEMAQDNHIMFLEEKFTSSSLERIISI